MNEYWTFVLICLLIGAVYGFFVPEKKHEAHDGN